MGNSLAGVTPAATTPRPRTSAKYDRKSGDYIMCSVLIRDLRSYRFCVCYAAARCIAQQHRVPSSSDGPSFFSFLDGTFCVSNIYTYVL